MQTEQQIREGLADCKDYISEINQNLTIAIALGNDDKIAEYASQLGMLGNVYLAVTEILR